MRSKSKGVTGSSLAKERLSACDFKPRHLLRARAGLLARHRNGRAMGFEKPFLRDVPFPWRCLAQWRDSALEPLPFRRPSGDRRSAVLDFHAEHAALCADRAKCLDATLRRGHPRASFRGRGLHSGPIAALALASRRRGPRGDHFHARRRRVLEAPAHRHDHFLFVLSGGLVVSRYRARAPLLFVSPLRLASPHP